MKNYIILYEPNKGLLDDYTHIQGKSGVQALNDYLPIHMVGVVKRSRQREIGAGNIDYILQQYIIKDGVKTAVGHKTCYTYHRPVITKVEV